MNHSPAEIVALELVARGFVSDPELETVWPCFSSVLPDEPADAVCVYNTTGVVQGREHRTGKTCESFGLTVMVRSTDESAGWLKAREVCEALDAIVRAVLKVDNDDYLIQGVHRVSGVIPLGGEQETGHRLFTINARATISLV